MDIVTIDRDGRYIHCGIIGLGAMGLQMAKHMAAKGFPVTDCDISQDQLRLCEEVGIKTGTSPANIAKCSQIVVVMVQTDRSNMFFWMRDCLTI
jgi:3-hydroxyisobutyrate dehydrogenase-like beta-hydroxyacid dehydrogenase